MNRIEHLKKTLSKNILDNKNYFNLEFVLLDYNSNDGMESYIEDNFSDEILKGRLVYYKTTIPKSFHRSHSRNLAFNLASGDIICNVDADNFTGKNFANYVNQIFTRHIDSFLSTVGGPQLSKDVAGRICVRKEDFHLIRGFDERMAGYGFEDFDILNRLEGLGLRRQLITESEFLHALQHGSFDRIANEYIILNLQHLFVHYITPSSSLLLFLLKDGTYIKGTLQDNKYSYHNNNLQANNLASFMDEYTLFELNWQIGQWSLKHSTVSLSSKLGTEGLKLIETKSLRLLVKKSKRPFKKFIEITDIKLIEKATFFYSLINNKIIMRSNTEHTSIVNLDGYGKGVVFKNFDVKNPISIN